MDITVRTDFFQEEVGFRGSSGELGCSECLTCGQRGDGEVVLSASGQRIDCDFVVETPDVIGEVFVEEFDLCRVRMGERGYRRGSRTMARSVLK